MREEGGGHIFEGVLFGNYSLSGECLFGGGGHLFEHGLLFKEIQFVILQKNVLNK